MRCLCLLLLATAPAWAQSRDCPPPGPGIPLELNLNSLPGAAASGAQGRALVTVPSAAPCTRPKRPHLPQDVLHGDPGDALTGEGPPDLLGGTPSR